MTTSLFLALVCVYALGIAGIVIAGRLVEAGTMPESLEQRLARIRAASAARQGHPPSL